MMLHHSIGIEHALWAAQEKLTPRQALAAAGIDWPRDREPDWHDCAHGVALVWLRLRIRRARRG